MRVLIYSANFAPDLTGIGKYSGDMAAWLVDHGYDVHVVAAPPYYPEWQVPPEYRPGYRRGYRRERWHNMSVWRAPLWVPKSPTGTKRILHLLTFALSSIPLMLAQIRWRPEIVLTVAPAFLCAPVGWATARLSGAKAWLHLQDFEIDVAFRLSLLKGARLQRFVQRIERWMLRRFDSVSSISYRMVESLINKGVPPARARFFPNWVDTRRIAPRPSNNAYRRLLGISEQAVVVLFSGSLSRKQGLMIIPHVASLLQHRRDVVFVICGDGVMKPQLEAAVQALSNVRFLSLQPTEKLGELLAMADIHLLPQSPGAADLVLPSKLTGMLASGRPIIATCEPSSEIERTVSKCGVVVPPEDAAAVAEAIIRLADDPPTRTRLGRRAREWAESQLERDAVLGRIFGAVQTEPASETPNPVTGAALKETIAVGEKQPA